MVINKCRINQSAHADRSFFNFKIKPGIIYRNFMNIIIIIYICVVHRPGKV